MIRLPDLGAIKSHIQIAFPNNKVSAWVEDPPVYPRKMQILTNVYNYGAFIIYIDAEHPPCEEDIEDILIAGIKDVIGTR